MAFRAPDDLDGLDWPPLRILNFYFIFLSFIKIFIIQVTLSIHNLWKHHFFFKNIKDIKSPKWPLGDGELFCYLGRPVKMLSFRYYGHFVGQECKKEPKIFNFKYLGSKITVGWWGAFLILRAARQCAYLWYRGAFMGQKCKKGSKLNVFKYDQWHIQTNGESVRIIFGIQIEPPIIT